MQNRNIYLTQSRLDFRRGQIAIQLSERASHDVFVNVEVLPRHTVARAGRIEESFRSVRITPIQRQEHSHETTGRSLIGKKRLLTIPANLLQRTLYTRSSE